jgi:hypothetical protein
MKVFYILLNICFPYYNVVNPIDTKTNGSIFMFCFAISISSLTTFIYGSISRCCIVDIFFSNVRIASTFSCSWIPSRFFSLTPFLKFGGIFSCTSSSYATPLLKSYDSSVCTSSS